MTAGPTPSATGFVDGLSSDAAVAELDRILGSEAFRAAPMAREFLSFVVRETLDGRGAQLNERKIARLALGRDREFDARANAGVRVQASRLRDRLDTYYRGEGRNDPIRIFMPVGQYATIALPHRSTRASPPNPAPTKGPGLAVFRFRSASSGGEDHRIAIGLSESLVHALTRFPGLRVIGPLQPSGRTATRSDLLDVGPRTNASFALSGRVATVGESVRVTVQLATTSTGEVVWSDEVDHPIDSLTGFAADEEIIARIVGRIADVHGVVLRHGDDLRHPTDDPGVYAAIAGYYTFQEDLDPAQLDATIAALEHAATIEPTNPLLLGVLGRTYAVDVLMRGPVAAAASLDRADELARTAIALDPLLPEGQAVLAVVTLARGEIEACRSHLAMLRRLAPHHPSFLYLAGLLTAGCGDWDEGISLIRRSIELNPHHPKHYGTLVAIDLLKRGDVAAALGEATLLGFPGYIWGPLLCAICTNLLGMTDAAAAAREALLKVAPDFFERPREWIGSAPAIPPEIVELLIGHTEALADLG